MNCLEIKNYLSEFMDRKLDSYVKIQVEEHLLACRECREEFQQLKRTNDLLKLISPVELSQEVRETIVKKAQSEKLKISTARIVFALASTAVIVFALLLPVNFLNKQPERMNVLSRHQFENKLAQHLHAMKLFTRQLELTRDHNRNVLTEEYKRSKIEDLTNQVTNVSIEDYQPEETVKSYLGLSYSLVSSTPDYAKEETRRVVAQLKGLLTVLGKRVPPKPVEVDIDSEGATNRFVEGKICLYKGTYPKAIGCFNTALSDITLKNDALYWIGETYALNGNLDKALESFIAVDDKRYLDSYVSTTVTGLANSSAYTVYFGTKPMATYDSNQLVLRLKNVNSIVSSGNYLNLVSLDDQTRSIIWETLAPTDTSLAFTTLYGSGWKLQADRKDSYQFIINTVQSQQDVEEKENK